MKRATTKVWTRAEMIETVKGLKAADYDVRKSDNKIEVYIDKDSGDIDMVFIAMKATPNTWLVRYDAALFDESLLEDEE